MEIFTARQPIFNKHLDIVAYEILFRTSYENAMPEIDGDTASSNVLANTYLNFGIEEITGGVKAFINFTENLILNEIPLIFPKESIVIEILENINPSAKIIEKCLEFKRKGYKLALDDFIFEKKFEPLINLADLIKIDIKATPASTIKELFSKLKNQNKTILAEKVETEKEFKETLDMGFDLFQGYFFCRPQIIKGKDIPSNKIQMLQLIAELHAPDADMGKITKIILKDVGFSYKLLRYINSAYFRRLEKISSVKDAAVLIGLTELKKLVSLIILTKMNSKNQTALLKNSAIRGKFCELIAQEINNPQYPPDALFTLGLFSHIEALLGFPLEKILKELPLTQEINTAYINRKGPLYPVLALIGLYEKTEWNKVEDLTNKLKLPPEKLPQIYIESCKWADNAFSAIK